MATATRSLNTTRGDIASARTRGLIRTFEAIWDMQADQFIECAHCGERFDRLDANRLDISDREDVRCECGRSGFVLRGGAAARSVKQRRPELSGTFYPSASELRTYLTELGLDGIDRLVIEAIDDFPEGWDLTYEKIGKAAAIGPDRVKARIKKLREKKLIGSEIRYFDGKRCGVMYNLQPLWQELARVVAAAGDPQEPQASEVAVLDVTTGEKPLKTTGDKTLYQLESLSTRELCHTTEREIALEHYSGGSALTDSDSIDGQSSPHTSQVPGRSTQRRTYKDFLAAEDKDAFLVSAMPWLQDREAA